MKKILSAVFALLLLSFCLSLPAAAELPAVTFSDDFSTLYLDGEAYCRFDATVLTYSYASPLDSALALTPEQQQSVRGVELRTNEAGNILSAEVTYRDGAVLSLSYLAERDRAAYNRMVSGEGETFTVDFLWPEGNTVETRRESLRGEPLRLGEDILNRCWEISVTTASEDGSITVLQGALLTWEDEFYYVDFAEAEVVSREQFYPAAYAELPAYRVTDPDLHARLQAAEEAYYADDLGFFYDDNLTETISAVFLVLVFAVLPLGILILCLIFATRTSGLYRRLFSVICTLSAAELAVFAILSAQIVLG